MRLLQSRYGWGSGGEDLAELVQHFRGAFFALRAGVQAVEERALLGEHEAGAAGDAGDLDRCDRDRDATAVEVHVVGPDDPLAIDDVLVEGVVVERRAVGDLAAQPFAAADAEVEGVLLGRVIAGAEPLRLRGLSGPGREHSFRSGRVAAFENEGVVDDAHFFSLVGGCSGFAARYSPRRSRRPSHACCRSLIQFCTVSKRLRSRWHVRTRPIFCERTRPHDSRTARCWTTAGSDIGSGLASSLTDAGPRPSSSTMRRRAGSARACSTSSTASEYLSTDLSFQTPADMSSRARKTSPG